MRSRMVRLLLLVLVSGPGFLLSAEPTTEKKESAAENATKSETDAAEATLEKSLEELAESPRLPKVDPPPRQEIEEGLKRGVAFLIVDQNKDGSWGTPRQTKGLNIYAPVPGAHHAFRGGTTSLCLTALLELESHPLFEGRDDLRKAIDRAEAWMFEELPELRRADPTAIYNVWGHGYALQALARMYLRKPEDAERQKAILELVEIQFDRLGRYESVAGGWGYYDFEVGSQRPASSSTSFVTAAILVAFDELRDLGIEPPDPLIRRGVASIKRQQLNNFSYAYGEYLKLYPVMGINRPAGSLGRSQACNLALRLWGDSDVTDKVMSTWLHRLFARNGWLSIGRKRPIPHESWFQVAGYFYYFGHYYAALTIESYPLEDQAQFRGSMAYLLLNLQEKDGSWWDYPLYDYHQQYGTAFALSSLWRCLEPLPSRKEMAKLPKETTPTTLPPAEF
ncbi:Squalene/oxidosqualene cyclase [Planctomycetales bacterium 10988]|nr:Squalene/oxidosqualene cyclase [Planctomycetales bacterium 10988]